MEIFKKILIIFRHFMRAYLQQLITRAISSSSEEFFVMHTLIYYDLNIMQIEKCKVVLSLTYCNIIFYVKELTKIVRFSLPVAYVSHITKSTENEHACFSSFLKNFMKFQLHLCANEFALVRFRIRLYRPYYYLLCSRALQPYFNIDRSEVIFVIGSVRNETTAMNI